MEKDEKKTDANQIVEWKKQHGSIYELTVGGKKCIVRKPTRQDLSYISVVRDPIKRKEVLLNQIWLDGDEEIKRDDELFLSLSLKLNELLSLKEVELKNL
jgi:hypothetical protein